MVNVPFSFNRGFFSASILLFDIYHVAFHFRTCTICEQDSSEYMTPLRWINLLITNDWMLVVRWATLITLVPYYAFEWTPVTVLNDCDSTPTMWRQSQSVSRSGISVASRHRGFQTCQVSGGKLVKILLQKWSCEVWSWSTSCYPCPFIAYWTSHCVCITTHGPHAPIDQPSFQFVRSSYSRLNWLTWLQSS